MLEKNIDLTGKTVLITGAAGFIGANLSMELLRKIKAIRIIGIDSLNDYYDVSLKKYRLARIETVQKEMSGEFIFIKGTIADKKMILDTFDKYHPDIVVNLAAQAGVRYSITNPDVYMEANVIGFYNILEACRHSRDNGREGVGHLVYASSSSVYGSNQKIPYSVEDKADHPVSLYAATKKSNELFAYAYAKLYKTPVTGLRFFTVYGPAGRPDMAYFSFTDKLVRGENIELFNYGKCKRDFTYIDDIVTGILAVMQRKPAVDKSGAPYKLYNIGNNHPENLLEFVAILGQELKSAGILPQSYDINTHIKLVGMQPGDVEITCADIRSLENDFGFRPATSLREGLRRFVRWYGGYQER